MTVDTIFGGARFAGATIKRCLDGRRAMAVCMISDILVGRKSYYFLWKNKMKCTDGLSWTEGSFIFLFKHILQNKDNIAFLCYAILMSRPWAIVYILVSSTKMNRREMHQMRQCQRLQRTRSMYLRLKKNENMKDVFSTKPLLSNWIWKVGQNILLK